MADQILSQEEIDALLSAMDKGEVELNPSAKGESVVEEYSLTSQSALLRSQFYALEEVYDKFATLLGAHLANTLQQKVKVELVSTEMVKYGEFISGFSNPTGLTIFTMDPLIGSALMAIEAKLVFSFIDCMFGGKGMPLNWMREFTLIEQRMIHKLAGEVLKKFEKAWSALMDIGIELRKTETKPEYAHLANPNDLMLVNVFGIKGAEFSGHIHFCFSHLMLEPIKDRLSANYPRENDAQHSWSEHLAASLRNTPVSVIAELGRTVHTLGDILDLKVDDVLSLPTGPKDHIVLTVEGVPKYQGFPGIIKGNRAVEIIKRLP